MEDNVGKYIIADGVIEDSSQTDDIDMNKGNMVYEVIRIIDGTPLFFADHYSRMVESFLAINSNMSIHSTELRKQIGKLVEANGNKNCNVKFVVFVVNGLQKVVGYISKSYYPTIEQINNGVQVGLLRLERQNPNIKLVNQEYKRTVNKEISESGIFEVLLVNNDGYITEGSASNVFFVKKNKIVTTPGDRVIKGVTRKHIIEACKSTKYEGTEELTHVNELDEVEGVFLTGTSKNVLPVSAIGDKRYSSAQHPVIIAVRDAYDQLMQKDIKENTYILK